MPEIRDFLSALPEPDPAATDRIWRRFQESRAPRRGWALPAIALAAASAAVWVAVRDPVREVRLEGQPVAWSGDISLGAAGHGTAHGTRGDLTVDWETGSVRVQVTPDAGNRVRVRTEEAEVEVTGTVFTVRRDALGSTTAVERGSVAVSCADGWAGAVTPDSGPHTCWPARAGGLLGRADALIEAAAPPDDVIATVDRGLSLADPGSAVEGELLARRVRAGSDANRVDDVRADAERYLSSNGGSRRVEVLRAVSRLLYRERGCTEALPYLQALETDGGAEDRVVLAACVPERSVALASAALASGEPLSDEWRSWAQSVVDERGQR